MDSDTGVSAVSLLGSDEPSPVELVNAGGRSSAVLVCDHASNRVPRQLGSLGLNAVRLADHIGWDPGAADVARQLSALLDAPLVLSSYSRLVIDCNRPLRSTESIAEQSAGVPVPGNRGLSPSERGSRVNALFWSYHDAIDRLLDARSRWLSLLLLSMSAMHQAIAATAADLDKDSRQALQTLYKTEPVAETLSHTAKAVLVFPNIVKAGLVFGGSYGEGVLLEDSKVVDYYNSVTGSWGLQIGAQSYGYAVFLMTDNAVEYLKESKGWEIGVGPTVAGNSHKIILFQDIADRWNGG